MNGIDISSHQRNIDISKVPCDFVIIKATQGIGYINPDFSRSITQALEQGKCVGVYHYASSGGAKAEAEHFLSCVGSYIGRVLLCLDWESYQNDNFSNVQYAKEFLDYVTAQTLVAPCIYMSKSVCREKNWSCVAPNYPLWCAQYQDKKPCIGYRESPWTDKKGFGAWINPIIFQYTSTGLLNGYLGSLDLDKTDMTIAMWNMLTKTSDQKGKDVTHIYVPGRTYTTQVELKVRSGPGVSCSAKKYSQLTKDAQQHDSDKDGALDKGTRVTCKEVKSLGSDIWIRTPSGWMAAYYGGKSYIS